MKIYFTIMFALFSMIMNAQSKNVKNEPSQEFKIFVFTKPLSFIDFYSGSSYKGGIELKLSNKFHLVSSAGGYLKNFNTWKNFKGYNLNLELKYITTLFQLTDTNKRNYFSINYFYKTQSFNFQDSIQIDNPYIADYRTQKYVSALNFNIGQMFVYKEIIIFDFYAGIGIRYKNVKSSISLEELTKGYYYSDSQSLSFVVRPGKYFYPNFNVGMRLGLKVF